MLVYSKVSNIFLMLVKLIELYIFFYISNSLYIELLSVIIFNGKCDDF